MCASFSMIQLLLAAKFFQGGGGGFLAQNKVLPMDCSVVVRSSVTLRGA